MFPNSQQRANPFADPFGMQIRVSRKNRASVPQQWIDAGVVDVGQKNDPFSTPTGPYAHGNGGLFSVAGQQPQIFSAMILPMAGFIDDLPLLPQGLGQEFDGPTEFGGMASPLHTYVTGVTKGAVESIANQPTVACEPGPAGGLLKACTVTMPFGKYRTSFDLDLEKISILRDRADPTYLQLMNMAPAQGNLVSTPLGQQGSSQILMNEFSKRAFTTAVSWRRFLAGRIFAGNPTNSAGSDNWKDIEGIDLQVNSGNHRDFLTNTVCTALDSDIKNFGSAIITSGTNGANVYRHLDMMYRYVEWNAQQQGVDPVSWKWVMHPNLFDELCKIWPVEQFTEALVAMAAFANGRVNVSGGEMIDARDAMRNGKFLPIRSKLIPVVLDNTITETNVTNNANLLAGQYASDIYLIPYTVLGGLPVTYIQPFNQDNGILQNVIQEGRILRTFTSDGGLFRWYVLEKMSCIQWDIMTMFRVRCHMPQLAARLQNVGYSPLQHVRDWNPDSSYFVNGGRTNVPQTSYYTDYSSTPTIIT